MNTSSTKTRALCVATRCTSVDQFVATFHRFCGDDETFFVATMTSRPIGLETAFSIQLADKKPVLRGMCIVLDAWETPENRYRRPGIRLGIKRLTADSQVVFDRLKAASRPAHGSVAEATPPPGPAPTPLQQIAAGRTPGFSRRSATPPPLPPLLPPKAAPPVPTLPRDTAPQLAVVHVPPLGSSGPPTPIPRLPRLGGGSLTPPPLPVVEAKSTPPTPVPSALPAEAKPSVPNVPGTPSVRPAAPTAPSASAAPSVPPVPKASSASAAPSVPAVPTVAASTPAKSPGSGAAIGAKPADAKPAGAKPADAKPADAKPVGAKSADAKSADAKSANAKSVDASWGEAKAPSAPLDAKPVAPNGASAATAGEPAPPPARSPIAVTRFQFALRVDTKPPPIVDVEFKPTELVPRRRLDPRIVSDPSGADSPDDALPAVIIDRLSGPMPAEPRDTLPGFTAPDFPGPAVDPLAVLRTPGSSLILPANPLQDLSDESIEGFVDCTLYEETENIFHPGVDGPEWADPVAESTPAPAPAPRTTPERVTPQRVTPERVTPQRVTPQRVTPQRVTPQRITPPSTVPAMPLDAPPHLTVHAVGDTESLAVAPDDPALLRTASGKLTRKPAQVMTAAAEPIPPRTMSGELGDATPVTVASDEIGARGAADGSTLNAELNAELAAELRSRPSAWRGDPGLGPSESVVVEPDPDQSWAASGELWSQTERRKPDSVPERLLSRPETPLPRPATNVPMDIGEGPDPASWFDSVSLPNAGGPGPQGLSIVIDGFAHEATPDPTAPGLGLPPPFAPGSPAEFGLAPGAPLPPGATGGFAPVGEPGSPFAPGLPPGFGPGATYPPGVTAGFAPPPGAPFAPPPFAPFAPFAPPGVPFPGATGGFAPAVESSAAFPPGGTGGFAPMPSGAFAPAADPAMYARYSAPNLGMATPPIGRSRPAWHRWVLIGGTAFAAIVIAFLIARVVRGANRAAPAPGISRAASAPAQPAAAAKPSPAPRPLAVAQAALAADPPAADPPAAAAAAARRAAAAPDGDPAGAGSDADPPDDDATVSASGAPVVGSGPCRFTVATTPAGSAVRFDDQPMGASPLTIQGSCDKHKLDVAHIRYQGVTKWVTLAQDKAQQLEISLARPVHSVTVMSFPPGAELSIDGRRAGTTPATIQMMGFAIVSLTLTKPGFQTVTKKVYSKVAQDRVFVKLMK